MTNEQSKAIQLADLIDANLAGAGDAEISAELRRLYAENEELKEQRDELLEALRKLHHGLDECDMVHDDQRSAYANASAIIAKATGETK